MTTVRRDGTEGLTFKSESAEDTVQHATLRNQRPEKDRAERPTDQVFARRGNRDGSFSGRRLKRSPSLSGSAAYRGLFGGRFATTRSHEYEHAR